VRKVRPRTGSAIRHQLGFYYRDPEKGPRFRVLVHLGAPDSPEAALDAWSNEAARLRDEGRDDEADALDARRNMLRRVLDEYPRREDFVMPVETKMRVVRHLRDYSAELGLLLDRPMPHDQRDRTRARLDDVVDLLDALEGEREEDE
jgi:hypothetical protein